MVTQRYTPLTHWGRVTHICVGKLSIIGSDNGLSPSRRQAIIWTNAGILLIGTLATNFSEISIEIYTFSFKKMHLNMSSGKWWSFCLGLNVLNLCSFRLNLQVSELLMHCNYLKRVKCYWYCSPSNGHSKIYPIKEHIKCIFFQAFT